MTEPNVIQYEGGEIHASLDDRTITGLLIPFNEVGRTNAGRFIVEAGAIALPADPSVITLNLDHDREQPVGRATRVWEEPVGIMASYAIANTPDGDAALADATDPNGKRRRLSGEFTTRIMAGKAVKGTGKLFGSALVPQGAFPSAMVLAADTPDPEASDTVSERFVSEFVDEQGVTWRRVEESTTTSDGTTTVTESTVTTTTEPAGESEPDPEGESTVTASAVAPTLITGAPQAATALDRGVDMRQVFAALNTLRTNRQDAEAMQVLAELVSVTPGGATPLPGAGVLQPNWVGQLFQGVPYVREYVTLGKLGTDISIEGKKGFKVKRGTAAAPVDGNFDGTWSGNKTDVKSYNGFSQVSASTRRNWAIAEDIAREFYDLPGGLEVVQAFLALIVEDYFVQSDDWALADWISTAGAPVAPDTAKYPTDYPAALGQLIQGILAVKKKKADGRRDVPSFAIANELAFEQLAYAAGGDQNLPAFVSIAVSTASQGTVDGNVKIVQGETGIDDTASVIVGADYAIEFDEVPGGPLQIDAVEIAKGGIDKAVHGYLQTFVVRPEAVVKIGVADA